MHDSIAKSRFFAYNKCGEGGGGMGFEPRFSSLGELSNGTELQGSWHCEI